MIGREGMTGLAVVLGRDRTPNGTYVQNAGALPCCLFCFYTRIHS
jgi:hypothetical protein